MRGGEDVPVVDEGASAELPAVVEQCGDPRPLVLLRRPPVDHTERVLALDSLDGLHVVLVVLLAVTDREVAANSALVEIDVLQVGALSILVLAALVASRSRVSAARRSAARRSALGRILTAAAAAATATATARVPSDSATTAGDSGDSARLSASGLGADWRAARMSARMSAWVSARVMTGSTAASAAGVPSDASADSAARNAGNLTGSRIATLSSGSRPASAAGLSARSWPALLSTAAADRVLRILRVVALTLADAGNAGHAAPRILGLSPTSSTSAAAANTPLLAPLSAGGLKYEQCCVERSTLF